MKRIKLFYALTLSLFILLTPQPKCFAQNIDNSLRLDDVVERELSGRRKDVYTIRAKADEFIYISVNQKGIDLVVSVYNSTARKLVEVDSPNGANGYEDVFFTTLESDTYTIEVVSLETEAPLGKYEIILKQHRVKVHTDEKVILAEKLLSEADLLVTKHESLNSVLEKYETILKIYEELVSVENYDKSRKQLFSGFKRANVLKSLGNVLFLMESYKDSIKYYDKALTVFVESEQPIQQGDCLARIGENLTLLGDKEKALGYYLKALVLYELSGYKTGKVITNNNIGSIYDSLGEKKQARQFFLDALTEAEPINHSILPNLYNNLGLVYEDLEQHQKALNYYEQALNLYVETKLTWNAGVVLSNIGIVHDNLGDLDRALHYYNQAISNFETAKTIVSKAKTLVNKGVVYTKKKEFSKALISYQEALNIFKEKNNLEGKANVLTKIAGLDLPEYSHEKKFHILKEALAIRKETLDLYGEAYTHLLLGDLLTEKGDYLNAKEAYENALKINVYIGDQRGEIATLYSLAKLQNKVDNVELAKQLIEKAIDLIESSRVNVEIQSLRTSYFAKSHSFYEFQIGLLMSNLSSEKGIVSGFEFSEKARARTFLDKLSQPTIYTSTDSKQVSKKRNQQSLLNHKINQLVVLKKDGLLEKIPDLEKEIDSLRIGLEKTELEIKREQLTQQTNLFKPLSLQEIQNDVLDADAVLLEYFIGEEQSFLWVVTKNTVKAYRLPKKQIIDGLTKTLDKNIAFRSSATVFTEDHEIMKADKKYLEVAKELSQIILDPFIKDFVGKTILIAGDETLNYISFGTLPVSLMNKKGLKTYLPLSEKAEVVNIPSASTLLALRSKAVSNPANAITIIADPVFDLKDERVSKHKERKTNEIALRSFSLERGGKAFPRLPFTKKEAESISKIAQSANYVCHTYSDFSAELKRVVEQITKDKIVHFATHGVSRNFQNGLSAIVLSLVDVEGNNVEGVLSSDVIASLNLNAELVTLSACETGLGENFAGEGTVGIAQSLMQAGAKRTVVSLWQVDDEATYELMKHFYLKVFEGKSYASALKYAQETVRKNPKWNHPFFWGAFIIQGEYR